MLNGVYINRYNLCRNVQVVKEHNPKSLICAMVKANAYGVGVQAVVKTIEGMVDFFGVANAKEARRVSKLTNTPVLVVGALDKDNVPNNVSQTCSSLDDVDFLIKKNCVYKIHLKINSGMNRIGFSSLKEFKIALQHIKNSKLVLEGVFTHFATTDELVEKQFKNFSRYLAILKQQKLQPIIHADNSFVNLTHNHSLDMVRVGFCLYNHSSSGFSPVVEIESRVEQVNKVKKGELVGYDYRCVARKSMRVAIVPIGYADGFRMGLIGFNLIVKGKACKVLNICMDCFMLDVSEVDIKNGDKIFILNKFNPLSSYAKYLSTSEYEIMCNFSFIRGKRKFLN